MAADSPANGAVRRSRREAARALAATVRFRVTALATFAVVVVLVVAGVVLVLTQRRLLTDNLDESLVQAAAALEVAVARDELPEVLTGFGDDDSVAQVVGPGGTLVAGTANLAGRTPLTPDPPGPAGGPGTFRSVEDLPHADEDFRVYSVAASGAGGSYVIHVGASLEDVSASIQVLTRSLSATVPAVSALLGALVWWLVGRTLRPVEAIRAEVAAIGGTQLHRRVPEPGTRDEIDRLARTMNSMLDRAEAAARQQRQFVADASHELRSPLTRIRAELEVDLAHPDRSDLAATHRSVLAETEGLQTLVDDLLRLARSDDLTSSPRREPVDLDDIVLAHARRLRAGGRIAVDTRGVTAVRVEGDTRELHRAVGNLADNAARYAAGSVTFRVGVRGDRAEVTVADDGPGIPAADRERVFERFTRLDDARNAATGGSGLGLAITRAIVNRHGGEVRIDDDEPGRAAAGARFVITLPADQSGGPTADEGA